MNKENVAHTQNGLLSSFEKEGNLVICDNMDKFEDIMLTETAQKQMDTYCMIPFTLGI